MAIPQPGVPIPISSSCSTGSAACSGLARHGRDDGRRAPGDGARCCPSTPPASSSSTATATSGSVPRSGTSSTVATPASSRSAPGWSAGWSPTAPPALVRDFETDGRFDALDGRTPRSLLAVPLSVGERVLGSLCLVRRVPAPPFVEADTTLVATIANSAALALENARLHEQERALRLRLEELNQLYAPGAPARRAAGAPRPRLQLGGEHRLPRAAHPADGHPGLRPDDPRRRRRGRRGPRLRRRDPRQRGAAGALRLRHPLRGRGAAGQRRPRAARGAAAATRRPGAAAPSSR